MTPLIWVTQTSPKTRQKGPWMLGLLVGCLSPPILFVWKPAMKACCSLSRRSFKFLAPVKSLWPRNLRLPCLLDESEIAGSHFHRFSLEWCTGSGSKDDAHGHIHTQVPKSVRNSGQRFVT